MRAIMISISWPSAPTFNSIYERATTLIPWGVLIKESLRSLHSPSWSAILLLLRMLLRPLPPR